MGCIKSKPGLSQEDLEFLKSHTRYDENTIKEWYKGFKQDCPNGRLTPPKFVDMYKLFFPSGNAEQFCDHVFRTFDTDKDGNIDFKEFLLAIDVTSTGSPEEKLKWAFRIRVTTKFLPRFLGKAERLCKESVMEERLILIWNPFKTLHLHDLEVPLCSFGSHGGF